MRPSSSRFTRAAYRSRVLGVNRCRTAEFRAAFALRVTISGCCLDGAQPHAFDMTPTRCYLHEGIMRGMRQRAIRSAGALLLVVALLLVPVVASAHRHGDVAAARSRANCVAAHHSPAIVVPAIGTTASVLAALAFVPPSRAAAPQPRRSSHSGRAPPSPAPVSVA